MKCTVLKLSIIAGFFLFVFPVHAHAYLDPGTGSYMLQMIAAAFFGGVYFLTTSWKRIKLFFMRFMPGKDKKKAEKDGRKED